MAVQVIGVRGEAGRRAAATHHATHPPRVRAPRMNLRRRTRELRDRAAELCSEIARTRDDVAAAIAAGDDREDAGALRVTCGWAFEQVAEAEMMFDSLLEAADSEEGDHAT